MVRNHHRASLARLYALIVLLGVTNALGNAQKRFFSAQDSIEMSIFADPETRVGNGGDTNVRFSPDGKYFAVVTVCGIIASNKLEATLWMFDSELVRSALASSNPQQVLLPRILARQAVTSNDGDVISNVKWSPDSKSIFFIGQNSGGRRQLYQADLRDGIVHQLTPHDVNVAQFEVEKNVGVFTASIPNEDLKRALDYESIEAGARAIRGMPLDAILFPRLSLESDVFKWHELWAIRGGKSRRMIDSDSRQSVRVISDNAFGRVLSLAPNGKSVIVLRPMSQWNPAWDSYEPNTPHSKFEPNGSTGLFTSWTNRPAEYALLNLVDGKTVSLVEAPLALLQGYGQPLRAVWSASTNRVLITATYLPLDGVDPQERPRRLRPCAVAIVETSSGKVSCLKAMSRTTDSNGLFVRDVSFGRSDKEVLVSEVTIENKGEQIERYEEHEGAWRTGLVLGRETNERRANRTPAEDSQSLALSIFVRQGLNESPALYATASMSVKPVKIWDPNPQLAMITLGEASILRWKDPTGYAWVAGLLRPPDYVPGKKYPLVIQTHGFFENRFLTDGGYTTALAARPLASAGIVVLQMPYNPINIGTGRELPDQIAGFDSAIDLLVSQGLIEPGQVGIVGFSRTAYHVESALIKEPERFAAATIADGVDESYIQYMLNAVGSGAPGSTEADAIYVAKPFGEGLKVWLESAPGFNLDKVRTPLRIEANSGPASVLAEWEIYASLFSQDKPVDLIFFPMGTHVLQKPAERLQSQQGTVDWFRFWLKDEEDSDPAKAEQYARWHRLRIQLGNIKSRN